LKIELLGELRVLATDGAPIALPASRKARGLLAYLVLTKRRHRRQHLCDLLWDGVDDPRAARRWSLSRLRSALNEPGEQRFDSDRVSVTVAENAFAVDLFELRDLVGKDLDTAPIEALREAANMFCGELLEGFELLDAFRFHSWCVGEREAARRLRVRILETLISRLSDTDEALLHAYDLVSVDPLDESKQTQVMRLLVQMGRQLDAEKQLRAYKRTLEVGLGVVPDDITRRLSKVIRDQSATAVPAQVRPVSVALDVPRERISSIPLVGRDAELGRFHTWLTEPHAQTALVLGDPGQGKTRLMDEVMRVAQERNVASLSGRAYAADNGT
jgi:DNA-binding SARP family transcriptional activator